MVPPLNRGVRRSHTNDDGVVVTPVRCRADITKFIRQPYSVYRNDPNWTPPLQREQRSLLVPGHNPFLDFATVELFLARRAARVVGRIAAILDPRYNAYHGNVHGFFGMFESVNDLDVAQALLATTAGWLHRQGRDTMLGPMNFSTNYECGLLIEGFEEPATVMMPYNPSYYPTLLEACGMTKVKDLWSWLLPPGGEPVRRMGTVAEAIRRRDGVTVRPIDLRTFDAEMARIKMIYHAAWANNWGFVPMTDHEFTHLAKRLRPVLRPELVRIAEVDGQPAGFALALPDVNQALQASRGRLTRFGLPVGLLRMLRTARSISRMRWVALGVTEEHRGCGLWMVLYVDILRAGHSLGYSQQEISWTLEDNRAVNRAIEAVDGVRTKTHRIYQRDLTRIRE